VTGLTGGDEGTGRTARAAEVARAERMYQEVMGRAPGPRPAGAAGLSRRVMFAAAGMTLIAGCGVPAAVNSGRRNGSGSLGRSPLDGGTPSAGASPESSGADPSGTGTAPADISSSPATPGEPTDPYTGGAATDPPQADVDGPNVVNNGPFPAGSVIQTKPQYYVDAGSKVIALTLDDGPSQYTSQILEILDEYKVIATFCMIGRQVSGYSSAVKEVAAAGHHITNHTWDHRDQSKLSRAEVTSELERTSEALADVGIVPTMYRAPYGSWSPTVFEVAASAGLRVLDWSVDPRDWSMPGVSSIVSNILKHTSTGKIILDHDGGGNRSQTVAAMRIWMPQLIEAGYRFTTP
jgi:peptidoglycan-N-acetylglucosamine deacetylase